MDPQTWLPLEITGILHRLHGVNLGHVMMNLRWSELDPVKHLKVKFFTFYLGYGRKDRNDRLTEQ